MSIDNIELDEKLINNNNNTTSIPDYNIISINSNNIFQNDNNITYDNYNNNNFTFSKINRKIQHFLIKRNSKKKLYSLFIIIPTFIIIIIITVLSSNGKNVLTKFNKYNKKSENIVNFKKNLINTNLYELFSSEYNNNNDLSPISNEIIKQEYKKIDLKGFISNLELPDNNNFNFGSFDTEEYIKFSKEGYSEKLAPFLRLNSNSDEDNNKIPCESLEYINEIEYSINKISLDQNLTAIRRHLLFKKDKLSNFVIHDNEEFLTEEEVVREHWFEFGASSVWLESEQCYISVTRLMFSSKATKARPDVSMVRTRAFDKNWNEINKMIPKHGIEIPLNINEQLNLIDLQFGSAKECYKYSKFSIEYFDCLDKLNEKVQQGERNKNKLLDKYYVTYPGILDISFDPNGYLRGPEDPKIILKKNKEIEEPIVVFNMENGRGRRIFGYMPHRGIDNYVQFYLKEDQDTAQKNWSPFFTKNDLNTLSMIRTGTIHFIRNNKPFEIVRCSLLDGSCDMVFKNEIKNVIKMENIIRGGTQFVQLPFGIPEVKNKEIWIGFMKSHIGHCGCGDIYYRPMLTLMIKDGNNYHIEMIVPTFDLQIQVLGWESRINKNSNCDYFNVLSPNSISSWYIDNKEPMRKDNGKMNDYLVFSYSESDQSSSVVTIKGILNYILKIYDTSNKISEEYEVNADNNFISGNMLRCMTEESRNDCKMYGISHPKSSKEDIEKIKEIEKKYGTDVEKNLKKQH